MRLHVIMYHYIRDMANSRYPDIKGLDIRSFKGQLDFLENTFHVIGIEDLFSNKFDDFENYALLTFDDGYIDHYTNVFPELYRRGLPGFFSMPAEIIKEEKVSDVNKIHFILASAEIDTVKKKVFQLLDYYRENGYDIPGNNELYGELAVNNSFDGSDTIFIKRLLQHKLEAGIRTLILNNLFIEFVGISEKVFAKELYMNMDQIKLMKKEGMYFGIHGYTHSWLGLMDIKTAKSDIDMALNVFDDVIDRNNWVMCYPYGSYNSETLNLLNQLKCSFGFTTKTSAAYLPCDKPLEIPRIDTNDFPPKSSNYLSIQQER